VVTILSIMHDITERKQEQVLMKLQMLVRSVCYVLVFKNRYKIVRFTFVSVFFLVSG